MIDIALINIYTLFTQLCGSEFRRQSRHVTRTYYSSITVKGPSAGAPAGGDESYPSKFSALGGYNFEVSKIVLGARIFFVRRIL